MTSRTKVPKPPIRPLSISMKQLQEMLAISPREAARLLDEGVIEARYHGRRRLVSMASVQAYWDSLPTERS